MCGIRLKCTKTFLMISSISYCQNYRSASGRAVTPSPRSASSPSLSALRSAALGKADQLLKSTSAILFFTRPSRVAVDERSEELQSVRTSVKGKRRSAQPEAVDLDGNNIRNLGQVELAGSTELALRSISRSHASTVNTLRAAFAKWVRGHAQALKRLEKSSAWRNGLSEAEREHMIQTWESLRRPGKTRPNRRLVRRFQSSLHEFAWWSVRNGFSLNAEIELINPRIVKCVVVQRRSKLVWLNSVTPRFEYQLPWRFDPDSEPHEWITDFDVVWTPHHRLRAKKTKTLTPYGERRLKSTTSGSLRGRSTKVRYRERICSVAELARLPEAVVSDKVIAKRLEEGWGVDQAVTTPRGSGGRPRKSSAENDKA